METAPLFERESTITLKPDVSLTRETNPFATNRNLQEPMILDQVSKKKESLKTEISEVLRLIENPTKQASPVILAPPQVDATDDVI